MRAAGLLPPLRWMFMTLMAQPGMTSLLKKPPLITTYRRAIEVGYQPDVRNALANIIRFT